jgi:hypothetical protein
MSSRRARVCKVTTSTTPQLRPAATELPGLDAEELSDPGPPLIGEGLPVDQDQRGCLVPGDHGAGDHGLARPRRRNEHPEIVQPR